MCDPVTLAVVSVGISALSTTAGFVGQGQQAKAQRRGANMAYGMEATQNAAQQNQIDAQQSENNVEALINASAAQGRISASLSESGATGATAQAQANALNNQVGRSLSIANLNSQNQRTQTAWDLAASGQTRDARVTAAQGPSVLSLALGLTKDVLGGFNTFTSAGGELPGSSSKSPTLPDYEDI